MRFLFSAKGVPEVVKLKSFPPVAGIRNKYFRGISPSFLKAYLGSASQHALHKSSLSIELILDLDSQEPLRWHSGKKKSSWQCRRCKRCRFDPLVRKISLE